MKILPLSTINDNRTILQEVLRIRKYLEENPCRNVFHIDEDYDDGTVAYDKTKVFIPLDFDSSIEGGDVIIFKNGYISVIDTVSTDYVVIKADTAVSIKGDKGDTGDTGATGATGNGISGIVKTGTSGLVDTYTIGFTNGTSTTFTVTNGKDGENGSTGNGISSITKTDTTGLVDTYTITFTNGTTTTFTVTNGADGVGVPVGGTTGQVLKKKSNTDYDTEWADESGGGSQTQLISMPENLIINPTFEINQRGSTSFSGTAKYTADRWYYNGVGSASIPSTPNTGYRFSISDGASISQFIELNSVNMKGYLLIGCTYFSSSGYSQPVISLTDDQGNNRTPIVTKTINIGSGLLHKQIIALFEINSIIGSLFATGEFKWIKVEFSSFANDSCSIANAFCYPISEIDTNSIVNSPIVVVTPNYNLELEKCKYYFEKTNPALYYARVSNSGSTSFSNGLITNASLAVLFILKEKRITPTVIKNGTPKFQVYSSSITFSTVDAIAGNFNNSAISILTENAVSTAIVGEMSILNISTSNYFSFDAEIYP